MWGSTVERKIQLRNGITLASLSLVAFLTNAFGYIFNEHLGFFQLFSFDYFEFIHLNIIALVLILWATVFDNKIARLSQCLIILVVGAVSMLSKDLSDSLGWLMLFVGVVVTYRYGFLTNIYRWLAVILFFAVVVVLVIMKVSNDSYITLIVKYVSLVCAISLIFFFTVEDALRSNEALYEKVKELQPISALGKKVSTLIHSLKNDVSCITSYLQLIEAGAEMTPVRLEKLMVNSRRLIEKINSCLYTSASELDKHPVDLNLILQGIKYLYLGEILYPQVKTEMDLPQEHVYALGERTQIVALLENVYSNAVEAFKDTGTRGSIVTCLTKGVLTIRNDAGTIPFCKGCEVGECSTGCPVFKNRGKTTKGYGSGVGLPSIFEACHELGWTLNISSPDDNSTCYTFRMTK